MHLIEVRKPDGVAGILRGALAPGTAPLPSSSPSSPGSPADTLGGGGAEDAAAPHFLFANLDRESVNRLIAAMTRVEVAQGAPVIRQGDRGAGMYVLTGGTCNVFVLGNKVRVGVLVRVRMGGGGPRLVFRLCSC